MRSILFLVSFYIVGSAWGATVPIHCETTSVNYKQQEIILNSKQAESNAQLFLFQNVGKQSFWLSHPVQHPAASAGWASQIKAQHWSALVLPAGQQNFAISCSQIKPGSVQQLSCKKMIVACEMTNVTFPKNSDGGYWAAENLDLKKLWQRLQQRGFQFK